MKCHGTLLCVMLLASVTSAARFALLIGNAYGGSDVVALKYVDNDLRALQSTLSSYCGFKKENIISISGKGPLEVGRAFETLKTGLPVNEENLLLLYYSGHADRQQLKMGNDRFPVAAMKEKFSAFPASVRIGIFDACQSGCFTRLKGGTLAEPFLFKDTGNIKGEVILSSSSPTENAQESDLLGNSIFTFHFVNALRGSGDVSGDGRVTLAEAYQYSYNHTISSTARTWGGVQHPSYQFKIQGEGDVVLADLTVSSTGVLLEGSIEGAVSLFDASDNIMADLTKERNTRMIIAVNPGAYQIVVGSMSGQKWKSSIKVPEKGVLPVHMQQLEKIEPVRLQHKGENGNNTFITIGVAPLCRYAMVNLQSSCEGLQDAFAGFDQFGIRPKFMDDGNGFGDGIGCHAAINTGWSGSLSFSHRQQRQISRYSGAQQATENDREYVTMLLVKESITIDVVDIGIGYRFDRRPIKGTLIQTGLYCFAIDHEVMSEVSVGLYDLSGTNDYHDKGSMVVPYAGIGYSYTCRYGIDIALLLRYRYQKSQRELTVYETSDANGETTQPHLAYNLKGLDMTLTISFNRRLRW